MAVRNAWADNSEGAKVRPGRVASLSLIGGGISSLRRGPDGNPQSPNAANFDEAKATPYPSLPDPLVLKNGKKVTKAQQWWNQRRPEIVENFDWEIYGRVPPNLPQVDAKGMFLGVAHAGPVYRLLGKKYLGTTELPPMETALIAEDIAFRQHSGGHTNGPNWPTFLTFAERYLQVTTPLVPKAK